MHLEDLGLIGNCQYSALVARNGSIVWCCLPRFDSDPIFGTLLDEKGAGDFAVSAPDEAAGTQRYLTNTNVLETTISNSTGTFRILDFAPRFVFNDRLFHPTQLVRIIEPMDGTPHITARCDPRLGWSKEKGKVYEGSGNLTFDGFASNLRLSTDIPLSYLGGRPFALTERRHLVLTWGAPVEQPLASLCDRYLNETVRYWQRWVKHCNIPPVYQKDVIRSALALKLHCFEDTGAIVAATTTSIPESAGSGRTWDYRYCWLRDASYALGAFRLLGHFEERERFVQYLLNLAATTTDLNLRPLYRIDGTSNLDESILTNWAGYNGDGPVRVGNGAAEHIQNDVFGEMVLALTPAFLDERFNVERSKATLELVERLARKAIAVVGTPDAGIWEYRTTWQPQTFSSLMCWAAADRMSLVAAQFAPSHQQEFQVAAARVRDEINKRAWNEKVGSYVSAYDGQDLDASLLQMASLRLFPTNDARLRSTVDAIWKTLSKDGWLFRYRLDDGFGRPQVAFVICTFWLIEALAATNRVEEAQEVMKLVHAAMSPLGLMAEDYETTSLRMWGNFPQAYSHVGLIHAAFAASPPTWTGVL